MLVLLVKTTSYGIDVYKVALRREPEAELQINQFLSENAARNFILSHYKGAIVREYNT